MNNIIAINGSPKPKDSTSGMLINQIETIFGTGIPAFQAIGLCQAKAGSAQRKNISALLPGLLGADVLLFVFPVYVDALPAPLLKLLVRIEQEAAKAEGSLPKVYAVCNCGFYEAGHTGLALEMIENFALRCGMAWGYGVGIGSGGFLASQGKNISKGLAFNVHAALRKLCESMREGTAGRQNVFVTPMVPRFLYTWLGNAGWRRMAKKYGSSKSLDARPHARQPAQAG